MNLILTTRILALPAALIGGGLVALVLLRLGRRSFSPRLFGVALACGAMTAFLPAGLGVIEARLHIVMEPIWQALTQAFVLAGLAEEGVKLAASYYLVKPYYERRTARDLALGVATVALGFALIENVVYVLAAAERWPATALMRMATAVPLHAMVGLVLGGGLARAMAAESAGMRALLIARAWLIAALLHGFYDFPLFLAQHAPLYPTAINQLALAFSATTPTLLSVFYLAAMLAACIGAARVVIGTEMKPQTTPSGVVATRPIWPRWLDRLVFARATGLVLGALLLIPAAVWIALAINATVEGIMPMLALDALSVCAASMMFSALLLLRAAPAPVAPRASRGRRIVAFGALVAIAAALFLFRGPIDAERRDLLANALLVSGASYSNQGDLDQAMENYNSALAYKPDFVAALFERAIANRTYQRYQRALDDLNSAARLAPDDAGILGERANAFENLHQPEKAVADLDRALVLKPDEPALLSMRAEILMNDGEFDKAGADLDRALKLKPDFPLARSARGDLLLQQFDYEGALRELSEAIRLDPNSATSYFARGRVHYFRGEYPAAIADLQQANGRQRDPYSALWLYLSRARAGQNGRDELIFWASALPRNAWPFPLIEFYLGVRPAPSVYAAAANPDQTCEADFYTGEWLVQQKLEQPAIERLRRAIAACPKSFIEYGGAVAELKRLEPAAAPQDAAPTAPQEPAAPNAIGQTPAAPASGDKP